MSTNVNPPATNARMGRRQSHGLSLVEVAVVMAIAGILSAVAYPSYQEQVRKSRRTDAQAVLMQAAEFLEKSYTENMRFDQNAAGVAVALPGSLQASPRDGATKYYTISLQSVAARSFVLQAVPQGAQGSDRCGTLSIDQVGVKSAAVSSCWIR